jgi:hypothetical protein
MPEWDEDRFLSAVDAVLGDEGRAVAENVARNMREPLRQTRNAVLSTAVPGRLIADAIASARPELGPQQERNLEASVKAHLRAAFRRAADSVARDLEARQYVRITPRLPGQEEITVEAMDQEQYDRDGSAGLGRHPHDTHIALPYPPNVDDADMRAALKVVRSNKRGEEREAAIRAAIEEAPGARR